MGPTAKRQIRYGLSVLLGLVLVLAGCSGPTQQTKGPTDETSDGSGGDETVKDPKKEPPKVVYKAQASEGSLRRIDDAVQTAIEGDLAAAIKTLKGVLDDDDQAFLAAYNLGVLYEDQGNNSEAKRYYEKALQIEADFSPAVLNLVRMEARTDGSPVSLADKYVAERPDNLEHKVARLEALAAEDRWDDLIASARDVLRVDEAHPRARYYLALAHYSNGRFPLSLYILDEALTIDERDAEIHFLRGLTLTELERLSEARGSFEQAVALRPDYPEAQNALGLEFYRDREWGEAENAFRTAITYAPKFQEAYLNLGNALKAQNRGNEAEEAYKKALELDSDWADAHFSLGALYLATEIIELQSLSGMQRLEEARAQLQKAKELWKEPETEELADQFLAKADKAIQIKQAELELQKMEQGGGDPFGEGDGDGDPFDDGGDGDGDPFNDDDGDPFNDDDGDPFNDGADDGGSDDGDPFNDGEDGDPFEEEEK